MACRESCGSNGTWKSQLVSLAAVCSTLLSAACFATTPYGIYDARTLGMGGASVAAANNSNAQFYNPALLAFNKEAEEHTEDARFLFPVLIPQFSETAITLEEITADNQASAITAAVNEYNLLPDMLTAQAVADAAARLDSSLAELDGEPVFADVYIGMAISEPGKFEGSGFFLGVRLLAAATPLVASQDRALLNAYHEGLLFIASGGTQGAAHPEIFDANGALLDPARNYDSTVTAAGAAITEVGVSTSRQLNIFGREIAAGFTFKAMQIDTFEDTQQLVNRQIDTERNNEIDALVNFDFGLAADIGEHWRFGVAVKDVLPHNYSTTLGTRIRMRPRARAGIAWNRGRLQLGADIDLTQNEPLEQEPATQEAAIGAEWSFGSATRLRAGYRLDARGHRDAVISAGIGTVWRGFVVDLAYAGGNDSRAAAIQFGKAF